MADTNKTTQGRTATKERTQEAAEKASQSARGGKETLAGLGGMTTEKAKAAARTVQSAVGTAAEQTAGKAGVAWTLVKARKAAVAGAGAGVVTVVASSYALGRRSGLRRRGPLSRLTGGRL
ncbi:hypothetical protein QWM81_28065 [Streptomyces ficellus]|uniref:DUF3618 domain-containing protein n=1 Tax=Streptomyces ficellus TaxID=1977088 RepID=A0ABT7ZE98_9ACTN|nr:hypothetical protein [Streptomyces ficellus]MDN3297827.1 hypothetical protein [Streptomyces ficellus]